MKSQRLLNQIPVIFAALGSLNQASTALAQDAGGEQSSINEIIVTAQKRSERQSDVPLSITAVQGDRLFELGVSGPQDLEKVALGFTFRPSAQGSPIFQIRGIGFFEEAIGVTPTVSVYLDQVPLPFSSMAEGVAFDLERVEVLKGPQGTLFGQNVTAGAINYIAAKPTEAFEAGLDLGYGRFGAAEVGGFLSGPLSSTLTARVSGRVERRDDWQRTYTRINEDGLFVVDTDAPRRTLGERRFESGRLLLNWNPSSRLDISLNLNGWRNRSDTQAQQFFVAAPDNPGNVSSVPFWSQFGSFPAAPQNSRFANWDTGTSFRRDDRFYQASLHGQYEISDSINLTSITAYSDLEAERPVDNDGTPFLSTFIINGGRLKSFSQELRLDGSIVGQRLNWMLGGNFTDDKSNELQRIFLRAPRTMAVLG